MRDDCDGFLGAVLAAEGTGGFRALVNGPGGCRSRTQILVHDMFPEYGGDSPCCLQSEFMGRTTRVPCTFLNGDDMVFGSSGKISDGIRSVAEATGDRIVLVDTLGASLQVADREAACEASGFGDRVVLSSEDVSSMSFSQGFDDTMRRIVEHMSPENGCSNGKRVNILGYGAFDQDWMFGKESIRAMLGAMGVEVISFVGADDAETIARSGSADFNVMVHPECARSTAEWYSEHLGIPFVEPSMGAPVGFDSCRRFLGEVSDVTDLEDGAAVGILDCEERRIFRAVRNYDKYAHSLRGYGAAFEGMPSDVLPLMEWMYSLFSLVPESVRILRTSDPVEREGIRRFLREIDAADALDAKIPESGVKAVFADHVTARRCKGEDHRRACVGIGMPFVGVCGIADRSLPWLNGCRYIVDSVLNGLGAFRCGQPTAADFK